MSVVSTRTLERPSIPDSRTAGWQMARLKRK
jgi:hypothetical protein